MKKILAVVFFILMVVALADADNGPQPLQRLQQIECPSTCLGRCYKNWMNEMCNKMCNVCCNHCGCATRHLCPCYDTMVNPKTGKLKCP
ncbi:hypothetical protein HU200_006967 [Digitaria exilis]|uniref:Uncharacterized protein n=1 Tax=Digitaria exilis TaxID=1010633 RepID=A0A835FNJ5_9POAL|nr:hypothetical protein HU200_006967 [Digitaria exilis]